MKQSLFDFDIICALQHFVRVPNRNCHLNTSNDGVKRENESNVYHKSQNIESNIMLMQPYLQRLS